MNKEELRNKYKNLRKGIIDLKKEYDALIMNKLLLSEYYEKAQTIAVYVSINEEVDTKEFIKKALNDGKTVCVPRIINGKTMSFYSIKSLEEVKDVGNFGILEPKIDGDKLILPYSIDLFIVPVLAFDKDRNRIGYGGGYYDRYFEGIKAPKIGIAYDIQMVNSIEVCETDIKMDEIITERRLIK